MPGSRGDPLRRPAILPTVDRDTTNPLPPMLRAVSPLPSGLKLPQIPTQVIAWNREAAPDDLRHIGTSFPMLTDLMEQAIARLQAEFDRQPLTTS